jgi:hypothetical protein
MRYLIETLSNTQVRIRVTKNEVTEEINYNPLTHRVAKIEAGKFTIIPRN